MITKGTYGYTPAGCRSRSDQPGTVEWWSPEASVLAGTGRPPCFQPAMGKQQHTLYEEMPFEYNSLKAHLNETLLQ